MTAGSWTAQLEALGSLIRARRMRAGLSLRELAGLSTVSNAYLSQIERGLHEPSLSVLSSIADALDVPLESLLGQAGMIGGGEDTGRMHDTEAAILEDPDLSEPQRIALLSVYRSFVPAGRRRRGPRPA